MGIIKRVVMGKKLILLLILMSSCGIYNSELKEPTINVGVTTPKSPLVNGSDNSQNNPNQVCFGVLCTEKINFDSLPFSERVNSMLLANKIKKSSHFRSNTKYNRYPPLFFVNLNKHSPNTIIYKHLQIRHIMPKRTTTSYGIYSPFVFGKIKNIIDQGLSQYGKKITINSGYRDPGYNALLKKATVNVAQYSRHQYGDAADLYSKDISSKIIEKICIRNGASYTMTYVRSRHAHCDWRNYSLPEEFYGASNEPQEDTTPIQLNDTYRIAALKDGKKIDWNKLEAGNIYTFYLQETALSEGTPASQWSLYYNGTNHLKTVALLIRKNEGGSLSFLLPSKGSYVIEAKVSSSPNIKPLAKKFIVN